MHPLRHRLEVVHRLAALDFDQPASLRPVVSTRSGKKVCAPNLDGRDLFVADVGAPPRTFVCTWLGGAGSGGRARAAPEPAERRWATRSLPLIRSSARLRVNRQSDREITATVILTRSRRAEVSRASLRTSRSSVAQDAIISRRGCPARPHRACPRRAAGPRRRPARRRHGAVGRPDRRPRRAARGDGLHRRRQGRPGDAHPRDADGAGSRTRNTSARLPGSASGCTSRSIRRMRRARCRSSSAATTRSPPGRSAPPPTSLPAAGQRSV